MKLKSKTWIDTEVCYDLSVQKNHNFFANGICVHNTNAAVCWDPVTQEMWCQSRENVITPLQDNAGFAIWAHGKREAFTEMFMEIHKSLRLEDTRYPIQIYGEWCGGNIQKSVGLNKLPKMFVVFGIRVSPDAESQKWFSREEITDSIVSNGIDLFHIYQFRTWQIDIDMARPEQSQQQLIDWTMEVETRCPVADYLLENLVDSSTELIGEGIVFTAIEALNSTLDVRGLRFKSKGEKHSVSKVKVIAAVDIEKVNSVNEFAENVCSVARFEQAIDKMKLDGLDTKDVKNTGTFIKLVMADIMREELDTIAGNGLTTKDISGPCATRIRNFYLNQEL